MVAVKTQDVMDKLLSCEAVEPLPETQMLNQLIYREDIYPEDNYREDNYREDKVLLDGEEAGDRVDQIWTASNDKVTVQVWDSRAKICLKVSQQAHQNICMKSIADIAVKAILDELKRDAQ